MTWKAEVRKLVELRSERGQVFSLDDAYQFVPELQHLYPDNRHIADKIRLTLQFLRDDGVFDFIDDRGLYRGT